MLSRVYCASTIGVHARLIEVEINMSAGLPRYFLVGLPDRAVSESRDRIEAALKNAGASFPRGRITVNLAPANVPKEGSSFDLPIALTLLAVSGQAPSGKLNQTLAVGELALNGKLRPVKGVLPIAEEARNSGLKYLVVPSSNGAEAAMVEGIDVLAFDNIRDVMQWLKCSNSADRVRINRDNLLKKNRPAGLPDFGDVRGQESVKRALEVAAAGGHNLVMVGPPGSGKTMMARRIPTILPPLTLDEALETTKIHSVAGILPAGQALVRERPFRSPHHTVSDVALVGGGSIPGPGEISMAHNGVLFLDELPEFRRTALEVMRQPLEDGFVHISRARISVTYPGRIMLVASMNPSPSGDWYDEADPGGDSPRQMQRYMGRISGPLTDRIDLHVDVEKVGYEELSAKAKGESSAQILERVLQSKQIQNRRFNGKSGIYGNAQMNTKTTRQLCPLDGTSGRLMRKAMKSLRLSARAYTRILKVSRTIADLDSSERIRANHIAEAIQYRSLDREGWLG
ncbi:MAG: YifB family Mg chelatase-like AAA ATPase [Balneolaceae bacterium]